jgi:DNA repair exonuclease SbcCD ATPase subunit
MKIGKVVGENFFRFERVEFSLDTKGVLLLHGVNKDDTSATSNGAGKSTLMELIDWTLWGATARGVGGADVIRPGQKSALGEVTLIDDDGSEWIISRARSKSKTTVKAVHSDASGKVGEFDFGTDKIATAFMEKLLGCDAEVFAAAVYPGQGTLPNLPMMTDKQLKLVIEQAAGATVLGAAYEIARDIARKSLARKDEITISLDMAHSRFTTSEAALESCKEKAREHDLGRERTVLELTEKLVEPRKRIEYLKDVLTKLPIAKLEASFKSLKERESGFVEEEETKTSLSEIVTRMERLTVKLEAAKMMAERECKLEERLLDDVAERISAPCVECGKMLESETLKEEYKSRKEALESAQKTLEKAIRESREAAQAEETAREKLAEHIAGMSDPSEMRHKIEAVRDLIRKRETFEAEMKGHVERCADIESSLARIRSTPNPFESMIESHKLEIEAAKEKIAELAMDKAVAEDASAVSQQAVSVFSPAGVRAHILDNVTPYLNARTSEYLGALSDGKIQAVWSTLTRNAKGDLIERFAIDVTHADGGPGYKALSGGEQRKVQIACALALQDLVASRATKPLELWVADEIDTALDTAGLERLMMVLQEKAKERGTVVVISHQSLHDWIPNVWTVTKKDGISSLAA